MLELALSGLIMNLDWVGFNLDIQVWIPRPPFPGPKPRLHVTGRVSLWRRHTPRGTRTLQPYSSFLCCGFGAGEEAGAECECARRFFVESFAPVEKMNQMMTKSILFLLDASALSFP
jgi:hypothetical protein